MPEELKHRLVELTAEVVDKIVSLADEYETDRDETIKLFTQGLTMVLIMGTFKEYKKED